MRHAERLGRITRAALVCACCLEFLGVGCGSEQRGGEPSTAAGGASGLLNITAGGVAGTTGGRGTSGGGVGAAGAGGSTPTRISQCGRTTAVLSGTWGGAQWMQTYDISAKFVSYNSGALWQFFYHVDTDGFLLLRGEGARPISDGAAHPVKAVLLTPSSGPEPATWFCSTTGSVVSSDSVDTHVDLKNLGRLGTCAGGVAVSGEIKVCDSPGISGTCDFTRTGTLDGVSITQANWDGTGGTSLAEVSIGYPDGMIIRFTRLNSNGPTGALIDAFVITPDETIYCAGANSDHTVDTAGNLINTLRSFMRVGNCAGVTGANTAQGCLGAR